MNLAGFSLALALIGGVALAQSASPIGTSPVGQSPIGQTPVGLWITEGSESRVEISSCGAFLCGRIVWLQAPLDQTGQAKTDRLNPDPAARDRPLLGLEILSNFAPSDEPGHWQGGRIYSPRDGDIYRATLTLVDANRLRVRGYIGLPLFGGSQIWQRDGANQGVPGLTDAKP